MLGLVLGIFRSMFWWLFFLRNTNVALNTFMTLVWCDLKWTAFLTSHDTCYLHPSAFMLSFHKVPFPCFVLHYRLIFILSFFSLSFSSIVSLEDIRLEFFHVRFYYVCGHLGYFSKLTSFVGSPLPIFRVLWPSLGEIVVTLS